MIASFRGNSFDFLWRSCFLAIGIITAACTPKIVKFDVIIPSSGGPPAADAALHQGTTHVLFYARMIQLVPIQFSHRFSGSGALGRSQRALLLPFLPMLFHPCGSNLDRYSGVQPRCAGDPGVPCGIARGKHGICLNGFPQEMADAYTEEYGHSPQ